MGFLLSCTLKVVWKELFQCLVQHTLLYLVGATDGFFSLLWWLEFFSPVVCFRFQLIILVKSYHNKLLINIDVDYFQHFTKIRCLCYVGITEVQGKERVLWGVQIGQERERVVNGLGPETGVVDHQWPENLIFDYSSESPRIISQIQGSSFRLCSGGVQGRGCHHRVHFKWSAGVSPQFI